MRYFLKTILEKDQRALLKLRASQLIQTSSESETKPIPGEEKRIMRHDLLLNRIIENLQRKTLTKYDIRLLEALGFNETIELLA